MQKSPIANYNLIRSTDIEETRERVGKLLWPHRMRLRSSEKWVNTRLDGVFIGDIALIYIHYGTPVTIDPGQISDYYLIQTTLSGNSRVSNGRREMDTGVGLTTVVSPSEATRIFMDQRCSHMILRVRRDALERCLMEQLDRSFTAPPVFELALSHDTPVGAAWFQTLQFLSRQYNAGGECLRAPIVQRQFAELAIGQLLNTHRHSYSDRLLRGARVALPWHVRRARDYIEDHLGEIITLAQLSREVGVSARTLQSGFQRFLEQTPSDYIRDRRLARAHNALRCAAPGSVSVTEVLVALGINNPGRFANYYRRRYGCLPSETLAHD
ncbi:AraC family transcriptional regulator [Kineobactrum salinum]|uniref:AraC family transcriptional regulator n=1 Tax=Kineobactrum salinum TaxID=2708301 RepID=A0A6C0U507_9GAMM|nr:AraC family transcriptional regulator [Kineobactrum salinum]QIB66499.1 AraC family transcriptional regulator [Kineobactrum salinum]